MELGELKILERLELKHNQLQGEIPQELGQISSLQVLSLGHNQLTGEIPTELGQLRFLRRLELGSNQLSGAIPSVLGKLEFLETLCLDQNQLTGAIPPELGELQHLRLLYLNQLQLSGQIPPELGQLKELQELFLNQNRLTGHIPADLGGLASIERMSLAQNQLSGQIPHELGQLQELQWLSLSHNYLTGGIADFGQFPKLQELFLESNWLSNISVLNISTLRVFDASCNNFSGAFAAHLFTEKLQVLDLSRNNFAGGISRLVDYFCALGHPSPGGVLQELRLSHNQFTGEVPPCLMRFARLKFLALNNNRFYGSLPEIQATELAVLTLHRNTLAGVLPKSMHRLRHLGVLTLHENSIQGSIGDLNLSIPCLDNSKFRLFYTYGCNEAARLAHVISQELRSQVRKNCPKSLGQCPATGSANLTLHRNRFSCKIPNSIGSADISGLVIMGNMLGDGSPLTSPWISIEEQQPFLYYSPDVWKSNLLVLIGLVILVTFASAICPVLWRRFPVVKRLRTFTAGARVVSSNLALWRGAMLSKVFTLRGAHMEVDNCLLEDHFSLQTWVFHFYVSSTESALCPTVTRSSKSI